MANVTPSKNLRAINLQAINLQASQGGNSLFLHEEELRAGVEDLFRVWRAISAAADPILAAEGLGRAHQRALYFIGSYPDLTVSDLMAHLGITKQSLSRVINRLVTDGLVEQRPGRRDRRRRQLRLTEAGRALEHRLTAAQKERLARAYQQAGAQAVHGFRLVLAGVAGAGMRS